MTARYTRPDRIDLGCSLENYALSLTLRDLADKAALGELEFLEVVAGCDGCDDREACLLEAEKDVETITDCEMIRLEREGKIREYK